jgi:hypothetical protein
MFPIYYRKQCQQKEEQLNSASPIALLFANTSSLQLRINFIRHMQLTLSNRISIKTYSMEQIYKIKAATVNFLPKPENTLNL